MSERFTKLYELQKNLYSEGSPVIVSAGSLLKDTQTSNIIVQLKFHSVSASTIKALKVGIAAFDIEGKEIDGVSEYQYLDLSIQNGQDFGSNKAVVMPDPVTRSFFIKSITVVFADGHIQNASVPLSSLPQPAVIQSVLRDAELIKQYKLKTNNSAAYVPQESYGLWQCHCGEWNSCSVCSRCNEQKSTAFEALDAPSLTNEMNIRLAEEAQRKAEAEQLAEMERQEKVKQQALKKAQQKETIRKAKIAAVILTPIVAIALVFVLWICPNVLHPSIEYNAAVALLEEGQYEEAIAAFEALGSYKDSPERIVEIETILLDGEYAKAEQLYKNGDYIAAAFAFEELSGFKDADAYAEKIWYEAYLHNSISTGYFHTIGLKSDGTVISTGSNRYGQCDVSGWSDIVSVAAGGYHSVGLKADGTVVAVGKNDCGQCEVTQWTDIISIVASEQFTLGLKSNGTVILAGEIVYGSIYEGDNVACISACRIAITSDGSVISLNQEGSTLWDDAQNYIAVSAGDSKYLAIREDGIVSSYDNEYVDTTTLKNVVQVAGGNNFAIAVHPDGTVSVVGKNANMQAATSWGDIVFISATDINGGHAVAIKLDGTAVAVGNNEHGQCNISEWVDIRVPEHMKVK